MEHPNGKVAQASHSLFTAFMSMGKESEKNDRVSLKEQLVFHYIQRSLLVFDSTKDLDPKSETETNNYECLFTLSCNMNTGISWHYSF